MIRTIQPNDFKKVDTLLHDAFTNTPHGYDGESELVTRIREDPTYDCDLEVVAVDDDDQIIGPGLLSQIIIENADHLKTIGLALAPLAVDPTYQRQGIGQQIIKELEKRAIAHGFSFISILGWPDYYQQFGYRPASKFNITASFDVPDDAYLIKALTQDDLDNISGTIHYLPAFGIE